MIHYVAENPLSLVRWRGSVVPRACTWAVPCSALAVLYSYVFHVWTDWSHSLEEEPTKFEVTAWGLITYVIGFLVVFRAQHAYNRYWEGITLVERACGVWLNGVSNLIAFCSTDPAKQEQVEEFQYVLSRLMSLLFCYCMSDITNLDRSHFFHLDLSGIDPACLEYLEATSAKQNVALQWLQRMIVECNRSGVIDIGAPILSRVFQELSIGIVHLMDAKKISVVPYPFGFAQIVWVMLVFFSLLPVPVMCAIGMSTQKAAGYTFLIVFVFWSVHHLAIQIEQPFGDAPNDLPLAQVNHRFNKVLVRLLEMTAQETPNLLKKPDMSMRFMQRKSSLEQTLPQRPQTMMKKVRSLLGEMDFSRAEGVGPDSSLPSSRRGTAASMSSLDSEITRRSASSASPADMARRSTGEAMRRRFRRRRGATPEHTRFSAPEAGAADAVQTEGSLGYGSVVLMESSRSLVQPEGSLGRGSVLRMESSPRRGSDTGTGTGPGEPRGRSPQTQQWRQVGRDDTKEPLGDWDVRYVPPEGTGLERQIPPSLFGECLEMPEGRLELQD